MAITLKDRFLNEFNPKAGVIGTQYDKKKYEKDISGGGYSGQPFIKRDAPTTLGQYFDLTTEALSLDFPIRGGSYEELASREDFTRIDRFLLYYPQGKAFIDKQKGLLRSNPILETYRSQGLAAGDSANRIYSDGRNLMEQIASIGTGFHISQPGPDIAYMLDSRNLYENIVPSKPKNENRLVSLYNLKILPQPEEGFSEFNSTVVRQGMSTRRDSIELFNYDGGPGSLYGLGNTLIRKATNNVGAVFNTNDAPNYIGNYYRTDFDGNRIQSREPVNYNYSNYLGASRFFANIPQLDNQFLGNNSENINYSAQLSGDGFIRANPNTTGPVKEETKSNFQYTMGYEALLESAQDGVKASTTVIRDFRKRVINPNSVQTRDYENIEINKTTRVGIGDPGARPANRRLDVNDQNDGIGQDKVNMYPITTLRNPVGIGGFSVIGGNRDLIKFVFETVNNKTPDISQAMFFRAYLTNYTDVHNASWDSKRYAGRGENFYTYQGFDRDVNFSFKVAAQSKQEMKYIYTKLNYLVSTLYPDYNDNGFMQGNITKLTIGDLFVRTPGILTSLNLSVDNQTAWEIALNEPEGGSDKDMLETPQIMNVEAAFKPILNTLPKTGVSSPIILTTPNNRYFRNAL